MVRSEELAKTLSTSTPEGVGGQAARGVAWNSVQSLVIRLSGLVVFLVLARLLQPVEFGLLAAAQVFVALSRILAESGLTRTLVQRPTLEATHLDSALLVSATIGGALTLAMAAFAPLISDLYGLPRLTAVLVALSAIPLISGLSSVPESILRRRLEFRSVALRGMFSVVLSGMIGVVLAVLGWGVWALVAQAVSQVVIAMIVLWIQAGWLPGRAWTRSAVKDLLGFGSHVMGISLLQFLNRRTGELLIGVVLGPVALGLYSVAMRILTLVLDLLVSNVEKVALPVFSRVAHQPQRLRSAYLRAIGITTFTAFPGFAALGLFGNQLTPLLFGEQWVDAGPLMSVLALIGPVQSVAIFNNAVILSTGRSRRALLWTAILATANVAAFAATVHLGIVAVAAAYVAANAILLPVGLSVVRTVSTIGLRDQLAVMVAPLAGCLVMTLGVLAFKEISDLRAVTEVLVGIPLALTLYAAVTLPFRWSLVTGGLRLLARRTKQ